MSLINSIKNIFSGIGKVKETLEDVKVFIEAVKMDDHLKGVLIQVQTTDSIIMKLRLIVAYLFTKVEEETKAFNTVKSKSDEQQKVLNLQSDTINDLRKEVEEKTEKLNQLEAVVKEMGEKLNQFEAKPEVPTPAEVKDLPRTTKNKRK